MNAVTPLAGAAPRAPGGLPALAPEVREVLARGVRSVRLVFPEDGSVGRIEDWQPPEQISEDVRERALVCLRAIEDHLEPAEPGYLLARILALLSHYPSREHSPQVEMAMAEDWADDIGEFPAWAVDNAARIWRRSERYRPHISEFRELCWRQVVDARRLRDRLRRLVRAG